MPLGAATKDDVDSALLEHEPPQERDAEAAALGGALIDLDARRIVLERLDTYDFLDPVHRTLFDFLGEVMASSLEEGETPDLVIVESALKAAGLYEQVGGRKALIALVDACPAPSNVGGYCRVLREARVAREAREAAIETLRATNGHDAAVDGDPVTDLGNAARFVRAAGGKARYVGGWGRWIIWTAGRWKRDDAFLIYKVAAKAARGIYDEAKTAADLKRQDSLGKWAVRSQSRERLAAMVDLARPDLAVDVNDLDADPFLLNVRNGTVNLRTGNLGRHRPADLITHQANVRFDPEATCPRFLAFLNRIMDDNTGLVAYLQRLFGMALTADVSEQAFWIFHGDGANGKSTLLDTISGLMGDYAGEAAPDLLLVRRNPEHPCEVADLCGRRLVMASEADEGRRLRVQLVKRLTGNARLKARLMRGDFFEFKRTHKLILATNSKPVIRESTLAIERRIHLVPFTVTIPNDKQDRHLTATLAKERAGILRWMVDGCLAWQRGGMDEPAEVLAATDAYRAENDILGDFLAECCILVSSVSAVRTNLYAAYVQHAEHTHDRYPLGRKAFYDRIRRRPGVGEEQRRIHGRMARLFTGIGLLSPEHVTHGD